MQRCVLLFLALFASLVRADDSGAALYKAKCARCHGPNGEGTKSYKQRLEGDLSVAQLADVIRKTMPENAPGTLEAKEAHAVAAFIHHAFYSTIARERNRPARIELARLTVRQYRHAVADVVGSFRGPTKDTAQRGLKAEYYKNRRFRPGDRVLERIDPQVAFDFGTDTPVPAKTTPDEFSIRWNGSLLVDYTGEYEFVVRTEHAARLWINDLRKPLLDAWVKSGKDTEYKATIFLVGGRLYPLRLEYSKAKQGVDDSKKQKGKAAPPVNSSVALLWKVPHQVVQPIPSRHLLPITNPEVFVCATAFPPDDRSYGWERGTNVSKEWDEATTEAALETASYVVNRLPEAKGQDFAYKFAERAFRRPLSQEMKETINRQLAAAKDPEAAIKRVVLLVLKSPRFLYREVGGVIYGMDVASRLSFGLWDSIPDADLLSMANKGTLTNKEQLTKQVERMLADPRGKAKLRDFLLTWLKADLAHDLAKDSKKYPGFDAATITDLRSSLELMLDDVAWSETSDFRELFLSEQVFVNDRLAKFYGVKEPLNAAFRKVKLDAGKRAGVLSHPYLMASFAHTNESSPIHRGVFLARGVLGMALRPPPEAVAPLAPALHPKLTTRERVALQTSPKACMTCHNVINPLGFALEEFDAVGRFRAKDNDKPVDATGSYLTREGNVVQVKGARELAKFLADSPEAHGAFIEQMFHYLVQQPLRAYGPNTGENLRKAFVEKKYSIRKLAVEVMLTAAPKPRAFP
jgi:hypothetical protein